MPRYKQLNYREININQVKEIMKEDFGFFDEVLDNVFCSKCPGAVTMKNYNIYLDEKGYVILHGYCANCGKKVVRVIETAEDPKSRKRALKIYGKIKSNPIPEKIRKETIEFTDRFLEDSKKNYNKYAEDMDKEEEMHYLSHLKEAKEVNEMLKNYKETK